ncbi:MAG: AI-2E family transporter [Patescibacteria group bacterium]|nr:AI-2E family transporter [Patescibacteria group bacterium]
MKLSKSLTEISIWSIVKIIVVLLVLWGLFLIRDIIAIVFISIIIAAALSPTVDKMARYKIPRALTVVGWYVLIIGVFAGIIYFVLPPVITQLRQLAEQLPTYFANFTNFVEQLREFGIQAHLIDGSQENLTALSNFLNNLTSELFSTTRGFIGGFVAMLTVLVLTLYLLLDENGIKKFFVALLPIKQKTQIVGVASKVGQGLGSWLRGQILLAIIVGAVVYIGLLLIGIPYALTLAILAGVLEIIPIIGPIVSAIPAILIALTISPTMALVITGFYILVQELENKFLVPKVMQYSVGLHPVTIIIVLLIGAKLMGIIGILLAVPVTTMLHIILKEWSTIGRGRIA